MAAESAGQGRVFLVLKKLFIPSRIMASSSRFVIDRVIEVAFEIGVTVEIVNNFYQSLNYLFDALSLG